MQTDEVRFLFDYDRWATKRVLAVLDGLDAAVWSRTNVVDERGLGGILVHQLGAAQRWRHGFQDTGEEPDPGGGAASDDRGVCANDGTPNGLPSTPGWRRSRTASSRYVHEGVPVWQMLVHVVNHGTQHRAEAAALLTAEGRSPGQLDLIDYAEEQAGVGADV